MATGFRLWAIGFWLTQMSNTLEVLDIYIYMLDISLKSSYHNLFSTFIKNNLDISNIYNIIAYKNLTETQKCFSYICWRM